MPSPTQRVLARVPARLRPFLVRHRRLVKFLVVGSGCFALTTVIDVELKFTVLAHAPVVALTVATVIATVVSYVLNRRWAFRTDGRRPEALLFFLVSAVAIGVNVIPLALSRYAFDLREPYIGPFQQEVADFLSGMVVGTFVAMLFRFWAMRRWVFTSPSARAHTGPEPGYAAPEMPRDVPERP
ncbi:GtrA family protein [Kitasatospora sp. NPDC058162]|uniref:GtrA family protein n=1 Tax=Kitasatospora sp. NPDC058162 TaxID=3346362 RepID=UPI0036DB990A